MTGAIDKELNAYINRMNRAEKKSLLSYVKNIFASREEEGEVNIEQYNKELEEADAAIDRGEFYTHEEAKEYLKKILNGKK